MRKIAILFLIIILFIPILFSSYSIAGAPKLIYEAVENTTSATIKAIQARKGFKVVKGGADEVDTQEVFTNAIAKEMQDSAVETWQVINGKAFEKTPLKNLPGWSKVVIGTAAFVTGADIAFDIYNKIQNGESIQTLDKNIDNNVIFANGFTISEVYSTTNWHYIDLYYKDKNLGVIVQSHATMGPITSFRLTNIYVRSNSEMIVSGIFFNPYYSDGAKVEKIIKESSIIAEVLEGLFVKNVNLLAEHIVSEPVPEIDLNKPTVTLIVPDPDFFPDINGAILENWDMVSDPERWLEEHPEHDPDKQEPEKEPIPDLPKPEPAYIPNPNYNPDVVPSVDNPKFIPNPDYNPDNPIVNDPTRNPEFDPITGEIGGEPIPDIPPVEDIDLTTFFLTIEKAFNKKYPVFSDIAAMYDVSTDMCDKWDGIKVSGLKIGNVVTSESTIVNSVYTNAVSPNLKIWISGIIWFLLGLYLIHKISSVLGAGK